MASFPKVATDFDQIIQADRQRRKNEELAKEIFGRNKQNNNNKKKDDKRSSRNSTPTLASRIGIAKRSSSASSTNLQSKFQSKPRNSLPGQNARANRIAKELNLDTATNLPASQPSNPFNATASTGTGISIKGASGPFVLHASNFAPGTTAADIESALHPDTIHSNGVSALVSCKIVSAKADVVAELVFTEKIVAESIIGKYNGQKADGRILRVELVRSGVGSMSKGHGQSQQQQQQQQQQPQQRQDKRDRQPRQQQLQPQSQSHQAVTPEPELEFEAEVQLPDDNIIMEDIEMDAEPSAAPDFNDEREAADRDRRNRDSRRDRHEHYDSKRRDGEDDRPRNNRDRDRDRERDGDRDTNRDVNRDVNRDREFERRDERPRDDRRGTMASHYGNGVGGGNSGPRGGFGGENSRGGYGSYRGNRYNDGYGGGRGGGYRGGYNRGYRG